MEVEENADVEVGATEVELFVGTVDEAGCETVVVEAGSSSSPARTISGTATARAMITTAAAIPIQTAAWPFLGGCGAAGP